MAGTLSATIALGTASNPAFAGNSALAAAIIEKYARTAGLTGAGALDVQSVTPRVQRNAALTGSSDLVCTPKQIYQYLANLFGGGGLSGTGKPSANVTASLGGGSALTASVSGITFTPFNEENTPRTNQAVPDGAAGAWITLIGGGGAGGDGTGVGSGNLTWYGGGGGGGAAVVKRSFVPRSAMGATYSVIVGAGGAVHVDITQGSGGPGGSSSFSSGGVTLTAGGGGGGEGLFAGNAGPADAGIAGVASTVGATGIATANGTTGGAGGSGVAPPNNTAGGAAGGGGGNQCRRTSSGNSNPQPATKGGNTVTQTGSAPTTSTTAAGIPGPLPAAGVPGAGAGGGGNPGGAGRGYGAGGGGGNSTFVNTAINGGAGGPGYTLIEWV